VKALTSILAAGAILALAAQAGIAAGVKHVKKSESARHSSIRVGYGPYAYLGNSASAKQSAIRVASGPYAYLGDTAPVGP
jgi:hypothetical protein